MPPRGVSGGVYEVAPRWGLQDRQPTDDHGRGISSADSRQIAHVTKRLAGGGHGLMHLSPISMGKGGPPKGRS